MLSATGGILLEDGDGSSCDDFLWRLHDKNNINTIIIQYLFNYTPSIVIIINYCITNITNLKSPTSIEMVILFGFVGVGRKLYFPIVLTKMTIETFCWMKHMAGSVKKHKWF